MSHVAVDSCIQLLRPGKCGSGLVRSLPVQVQTCPFLDPSAFPVSNPGQHWGRSGPSLGLHPVHLSYWSKVQGSGTSPLCESPTGEPKISDRFSFVCPPPPLQHAAKYPQNLPLGDNTYGMWERRQVFFCRRSLSRRPLLSSSLITTYERQRDLQVDFHGGRGLSTT